MGLKRKTIQSHSAHKKVEVEEFIGIKGMWGHLTDKNNPFKNPEDPMLFRFPKESNIMSNQPYWEAIVGIHNIFKFFGVDYVRRLTYRIYQTQMNGA